MVNVSLIHEQYNSGFQMGSGYNSATDVRWHIVIICKFQSVYGLFLFNFFIVFKNIFCTTFKDLKKGNLQILTQNE